MEQAKNKAKLVSFSPQGWEQLQAIKEDHGMINDMEAIRYAVSFTYSKENPAYVRAIRERVTSTENMTPEERETAKLESAEAKVLAKEKMAEVKRLAAIENGERIMLELHGKEKLDKHNNRKCVYYTYGWLNTANATITEHSKYLDELTDEDIENQYYNINTKEPMPADVVIATLEELKLIDKNGKPI